MNDPVEHSALSAADSAAVEWHVRLSSGEATDADYQAFSEWLSADPENFTAYEKAETLADQINAARNTDDRAFDHLIAQSPKEKSARAYRPAWGRLSPQIFAAIAATMLVALAISYSIRTPYKEPKFYATENSEFQTVSLDDGSLIVLAPGALMSVSFEADHRRITSFEGKGFFDVKSDAERPFTVAFGDREIVVVGTQFEVSTAGQARSVAVAEGIVLVDNGAGAQRVQLTVGDRLKFTEAEPKGALEKIQPTDIGAWRSGYFEFDGASLEIVISRLNEFYGDETFVSTKTPSPGIRFDGVLTLSDPEGTARRLTELLPLLATPTAQGIELKPIAQD